MEVKDATFFALNQSQTISISFRAEYPHIFEQKNYCKISGVSSQNLKIERLLSIATTTGLTIDG